MARYLITGITGFVGSTLAHALLQANPKTDIIGVDDMSSGDMKRLEGIREKIVFIPTCVSSLKDYDIEVLGKIDAIIHCAAIAPLPECQKDMYRALVQNVAMCGAIADFATRVGCTRIIFFSSGAVYEGQRSSNPSHESDSLYPRLVYPTTKYLAEEFWQATCESYNLDVTAIRLFNLYGKNQSYHRKQPPLIGYLLKCLLTNETATLYGDGEQKRDYIYIDDLMRLVQALLARPKHELSYGFGVINACTSDPISVNEIIGHLEQMSGEKLDIVRKKGTEYWDKYPELFDRKIPLQRRVVDKEVHKSTHGSSANMLRYISGPFVSMEQGLEECYYFAKKIFANQEVQ